MTSGISPGERNVNPLQYPCLENSVGRGIWRAIVPEVTKSQTGLTSHTVEGFSVVNEAEVDVFFWNSLAFSVIQWMLAI